MVVFLALVLGLVLGYLIGWNRHRVIIEREAIEQMADEALADYDAGRTFSLERP